MNHETTRIEWSLEDLRDYFGLRMRSCDKRRFARSRYYDREAFCPMSFSEAPMKLHESATHPGGIPVHVEGGYPAHTRGFMARLDGIPFGMMKEAVQYLQQYDREAWRSLQAVMDRYPLDTAKMVAERVNCDKSALFKRINRALITISSYVDRELLRKALDA